MTYLNEKEETQTSYMWWIYINMKEINRAKGQY